MSPTGDAFGIGSLNEKALHAALKEWYAQPGDGVEVPIDGYCIDIVRGDLLIEIQTGNFSGLKRKLLALLADHRVHLVYPVAAEKWLVKVAEDRQSILARRKSPKRGSVVDVFEELVSFPQAFTNPWFSLQVLMIQEEEVRYHDSTRGWRRRGWITHERRLLRVLDSHLFESVHDMRALLPSNLPTPFTTRDLALSLARPRRLAQRMAYCLRHMGLITPVGKERHGIQYVPTSPGQDRSP